MIEREGNVAAMIIEPIVGTNGVLVPPKEYLPKLRALTKQHGVLLIADEVMTGWGRTGEWFAVDQAAARRDRPRHPVPPPRASPAPTCRSA